MERIPNVWTHFYDRQMKRCKLTSQCLEALKLEVSPRTGPAPGAEARPLLRQGITLPPQGGRVLNNHAVSGLEACPACRIARRPLGPLGKLAVDNWKGILRRGVVVSVSDSGCWGQGFESPCCHSFLYGDLWQDLVIPLLGHNCCTYVRSEVS